MNYKWNINRSTIKCGVKMHVTNYANNTGIRLLARDWCQSQKQDTYTQRSNWVIITIINIIELPCTDEKRLRLPSTAKLQSSRRQNERIPYEREVGISSHKGLPFGTGIETHYWHKHLHAFNLILRYNKRLNCTNNFEW